MTEFQVARSTTVENDPTRVHALVEDFHEWTKWSPWEDLDPDLQRDYSGPESGVGARYAWRGNRKAGAGSMEITGSTPDRIDIDLRFHKPFKARNVISFLLAPVAGGGTEVTWLMTGKNTGFTALFTKVVGMDRLVGKDFERGLARLKAVAEQPA